MERDVLENVNPHVFEKLPPRLLTKDCDRGYDPVDSREIFDLICTIRDPEHPMTLEELGVVTLQNIQVDDEKSIVKINYTPTIPHCSMATLIGLSIRVKLIRTLASRFKVTVEITPGTHASEHAINKQLADKERVAAAMENKHLSGVIDQCICFDDTRDNKVIEDVDDGMKRQIFGETYELLDKLNVKVDTVGKYDFLKESDPQLYRDFIFLENVNEDLVNRLRERHVEKPKVTEKDILADLEYLMAC